MDISGKKTIVIVPNSMNLLCFYTYIAPIKPKIKVINNLRGFPTSIDVKGTFQTHFIVVLFFLVWKRHFYFCKGEWS